MNQQFNVYIDGKPIAVSFTFKIVLNSIYYRSMLPTPLYRPALRLG